MISKIDSTNVFTYDVPKKLAEFSSLNTRPHTSAVVPNMYAPNRVLVQYITQYRHLIGGVVIFGTLLIWYGMPLIW